MAAAGGRSYFAAQVALRNAILNASTNDTLYRLNQGRFEVGKISENDLLQSELEQLRARTALDQSRLEHDRALAALRLVGSSIDDWRTLSLARRARGIADRGVIRRTIGQAFALLVTGNWVLSELVSFTQSLFDQLPRLLDRT